MPNSGLPDISNTPNAATLWQQVKPDRSAVELKARASPQTVSDLPADKLQEQMTARLLRPENEVLSRTSLSALIQDPRLNLYAEELKTQPLELNFHA